MVASSSSEKQQTDGSDQYDGPTPSIFRQEVSHVTCKRTFTVRFFVWRMPTCHNGLFTQMKGVTMLLKSESGVDRKVFFFVVNKLKKTLYSLASFSNIQVLTFVQFMAKLGNNITSLPSLEQIHVTGNEKQTKYNLNKPKQFSPKSLTRT